MQFFANAADWIVGFTVIAGVTTFIVYLLTHIIHGAAGVVSGLLVGGVSLYLLWTGLGDGSWVPHSSGITLIAFMASVAMIAFAIMHIEMVHHSWVAQTVVVLTALLLIVMAAGQLTRVGVVPPPVALHSAETQAAAIAERHLPPVPAPSEVISTSVPSTTGQVISPVRSAKMTAIPSLPYTAAECDRAQKAGASPKFLADHGCKATSSVRTSTKSVTPTVRYTTAECGYAQKAGASPKFLADHGCQ